MNAATIATVNKPHYIREWRKHRGLTMEALAERMGVSTAVVSRIERGLQRYNQDILEAAAAALATSPAALLSSDPMAASTLGDLSDEKRAAVEAVLKLLTEDKAR